jgi:7-cyano-7-deazaguanine synthase
MSKVQSRKKKAVLLFSGGLDSTTVLFLAKKQGYDCRCLSFDYGQRHKKELLVAKNIAKKLHCPIQVVKINLPWTHSSLIDINKKIPRHRTLDVGLWTSVLPSTYVPGRNTIFLSFALSYAESIGAEKIFIGANAIDFSGYPDCRPAYYGAWNKVLKALGTKINIEVPLIRKTKAQIIKLGTKLRVPYKLTWSCYKGGKKPCGKCDSCRFRSKGFIEAGVNEKEL